MYFRASNCSSAMAVAENKHQDPDEKNQVAVGVRTKPVKTVRYIGDIPETPTSEEWSAAVPKIKSQLARNQSTIKRLRARCRRLTNKVASMEQLMNKLRSKQLIDDWENSPLQVNLV